MQDSKLVPIERRDGVTLYGRVIGKGNKLGQFEVHSKYLGNDGMVYSLYKDAEIKFKAIIGVSKP